jgi:hypothetical protein
VRMRLPALFGLLVFMLIAGCAEKAKAADRRFFAGGGILSQNVGQYAVDVSGNTKLFARQFYALSLAARLPLGNPLGRYRFLPLLVVTPAGRASADGDVRARILVVGARAGYELAAGSFTSWQIYGGPAISFQSISGKGGVISQNNGTSTTLFALPGGASTTSLFVLDFGTGFEVGLLRFDVDAFVSDILGSRRAFTLMAGLSLGFNL